MEASLKNSRMTKVWIPADQAQLPGPMRANRVAIAIQLDRFVSAAKRIRRDGLPLKANLFV
jgi:hypothetical protein